jgi:hypothetical protein
MDDATKARLDALDAQWKEILETGAAIDAVSNRMTEAASPKAANPLHGRLKATLEAMGHKGDVIASIVARIGSRVTTTADGSLRVTDDARGRTLSVTEWVATREGKQAISEPARKFKAERERVLAAEVARPRTIVGHMQEQALVQALREQGLRGGALDLVAEFLWTRANIEGAENIGKVSDEVFLDHMLGSGGSGGATGRSAPGGRITVDGQSLADWLKSDLGGKVVESATAGRLKTASVITNRNLLGDPNADAWDGRQIESSADFVAYMTGAPPPSEDRSERARLAVEQAYGGPTDADRELDRAVMDSLGPAGMLGADDV